MDRNLSISQNGEVFTKFNEANERLDILFQNMKKFITEQEVKEDARNN
jgi:hypothetical protein